MISMKDVNLSKRMEAVVNMISPQSFAIADVGCDHAYVSIALVQRGLAQKVIAMDVRTGPLEIAKRNVRETGYSEKIDVRLGDGLERLQQGEADGIVIAGMGGLLMKSILERGMHILMYEQKRPVLVLQPQSDVKEVRMFLHSHAYHIVSEQMLKEDGKYYTVIKAEPVEGKLSEQYTTAEWVYGKCNLADNNQVLYEYLQKEQKVLKKILNQVEASIKQSEKCGEEIPHSTRNRLDSVTCELAINAQALSYYVER